MLGHQFVVKNSRVWHPNTQMSEWSGFGKITSRKGEKKETTRIAHFLFLFYFICVVFNAICTLFSATVD